MIVKQNVYYDCRTVKMYLEHLFKVLNDEEKYRTPLANALSNIKQVEALLEEEAFK